MWDKKPNRVHKLGKHLPEEQMPSLENRNQHTPVCVFSFQQTYTLKTMQVPSKTNSTFLGNPL